MQIVEFLPYIQIVLSLILVGAILLQQRGAGLGGAFGGVEPFGMGTRRGAEKWVFYATIAIAVLFIVFAVVSLTIK